MIDEIQFQLIISLEITIILLKNLKLKRRSVGMKLKLFMSFNLHQMNIFIGIDLMKTSFDVNTKK